MGRIKGIVAVLLAAIIFFSCVPISVQATVGPFAAVRRVIIDGTLFEPWGVFEDWSLSHFRLEDMAYMLKDTPARFNIRATDNERLDFWIVRGENYTPAGGELRPISFFFEEGLDEPPWFDGDFYGNVNIGVDGTDEPETAIALFARGDEDGFYFRVEDLAVLFGFSIEWTSTGYFYHSIYDDYVENADYVISTEGSTPAALPIHSVELFELMMKLSGHWVDSAHFISPVINESVVWPVELHFSPEGNGINHYSWNTVAPARPWNPALMYDWYPLSMRYLENGFVELSVTGPSASAWNHVTPYTNNDYLPQRIVADTSSEQIDELMYTISGRTYHMVRADSGSSRRYYAEPAEDNGIRLLYVLGGNINLNNDGFSIYRSQVQGERGESVFFTDDFSNHRVLFEFIDTTAERGIVYYYSLWKVGSWLGNHYEILFNDDEWQIRVDADAVLGAEAIEDIEEIAEIEIPEADENEGMNFPETEELPTIHRWILSAVLFIAAAITVAFLLKRKSRER